MRARLAAVVFLLSATAGAVDLGGRARVSVNAGIDTNPRRDFVSPDAGGTPSDGVLQGVANLSGYLAGERGTLGAAYDLGARKFVLLSSEDTVVQSVQLDGNLWLPGGFALGVTARGRDRRGASRDYTDLAAEGTLEFAPDAQLDLRLRGSAHRFIFWSGFRSSFYAPEAGLSVRYRINKRHSFTVVGDLSFRTFNADAYPNPETMPVPDAMVRKDFFAVVSAAYTYRGPVNVTLSYSYLDSSSNSYGESYRQHRVGLLFGAALPWELNLLVNANLRFAQYPDGVFLSPELIVLEEDENQTSGVIKLVRPIGEHFDVEVRYGLYYGRLPKNDFVYLRHVASIGASVRF